jgi:hypothetical protein
MAKDNNKDIKTFNMAMPKETWLFLKDRAAIQEEPMAAIILRCVDKYKKKFDSRLTPDHTNV